MSEMEMTRIGDTDICITRRFKATPRQVYDAHTKPELIRQWMLGPDGWTMPECESDPVPGGRMRFTWAHPQQGSFTMEGTYFELDPPHRIVHGEEWAADDMSKTRVTTTFDADDTGTLMTLVIEYPSPEAREAAIGTGMTDGMEMSYARIDGIPGL